MKNCNPLDTLIEFACFSTSPIASFVEFLYPFIIERSFLFSASMNSVITDSGLKDILRTHHRLSDCVFECAVQAIVAIS